MDKRSLLAIVLSVIILIAYQGILSYLYPPTQKTVPTQPAEPINAAAPSAPQSSQKKENQAELTSPSGVQGSVPQDMQSRSKMKSIRRSSPLLVGGSRACV